MSEMEILQKCRLAASKLGARLFRNNTGQAFAGKHIRITKPMTIHVSYGDVVVYKASTIRYGLCVGSSDLIGWVPIKITPEMVGKTVATFCATEVKDKSTTTKEQDNFLRVVQDSGGIAFVARHEREIEHGVREYVERVSGSIQKSREEPGNSSEGAADCLDSEWKV